MKLRSDFQTSPLGKFLAWVRKGSGALDRWMRDEPVGDRYVEAEDKGFHLREQALVEEEMRVQDRMHEWIERSGSASIRRFYYICATVFAILIISVLLYTVSFLPKVGATESPVLNEVVERYNADGLEETGAVNIVAGMILDYRAFDTLGESNVLFLAACAVFLLLRVRLDATGHVTQKKLDAEANDRRYEPHKDTILMRIADALVPIILLFGLYIVFNGHLSPGGGFSGGAVMGAGMILFLNAHGYTGTQKFRLFSYTTYKGTSFAALTFYCASKCYSFFTGANGLESFISEGTPGSIFSAGLILPLNICVGFVVAFTMFGFYTLFRKGDF